jgi:WD40 repeat protein
MGKYEYSCFGDDHALLANKDGDILYYNFINQNTFLIDRQHPSLFSSLQIHNIDQIFITCGGNVKNNSQESEKIIKVWSPNKEDELIMKNRIVTGHTKTIENSIILGRNKIITLSTDKTVRTINLSTNQFESIIPVDIDFYSGCPIDWNTIMLAGIGPKINIYDIRNKKLTKTNKLNHDIIQISKICRLTETSFLLSNIN